MARQVDEEFVEEVYPSENVQVVQPDQGEVAAVVYAAVVHPEPKEEVIEPIPEPIEDTPEPIEPKEDTIEDIPEPVEDILEIENEISAETRHEHEVEHEHEEVDNADEHVNDEMDDQESTEQPEQTTTELPEIDLYTTLPPFDYDSADPARENEEGPVIEETEPILETSKNPEWEQKDVVIMHKPAECMDMKNDLFINIMSTILTTLTQFETETVTSVNTALFKSEGGCLPSDVNQVFTSSCI